MKKIILLFSCIVLLGVCSGAVYAESHSPGESWLGIGIINPVQYPDQSFSLRGLRVNIHAVNEDLTGANIGLANYLNGDLSGFQLGLYNEVSGSASGFQVGIVNDVAGGGKGYQLAFANYTSGRYEGVQLSFYNRAEHISGLQLGLVNSTQTLHGVQLGILNLKQEVGRGVPYSWPMRGFPIINWTF